MTDERPGVKRNISLVFLLLPGFIQLHMWGGDRREGGEERGGEGRGEEEGDEKKERKKGRKKGGGGPMASFWADI